MIRISDIRIVLVALELMLGLGLLLYRAMPARNAPDDPAAAHDYAARRRRYAALVVLFLVAIQIPVLLTHPS